MSKRISAEYMEDGTLHTERLEGMTYREELGLIIALCAGFAHDHPEGWHVIEGLARRAQTDPPPPPTHSFTVQDADPEEKPS